MGNPATRAIRPHVSTNASRVATSFFQPSPCHQFAMKSVKN
jgi:hypothetical protein